MAIVQERTRGDGGITYRVCWRAGGKRDGKQESESFDERRQADTFKGLVELNGHHWPKGWVRGRGFVEQEPAKGPDQPFAQWAHRYVERLNGIEDRTRHDYKRIVDLHLVPCLPEAATVGNVTKDDIQDWVRLQETGKPDPDDPDKWERLPGGPKSISNRHGLLWSIFQAAVEAEPPIRPANPCSGTKLPRLDDGTEEEMVFLERAEYRRLRGELCEICGGDSVELADFLVGTALRWGEATALQVRDLQLDAATPTLRVQRAWKRQDDNTFKLGPPKTKKARRSVALNPTLAAMLRQRTVGKGPQDYVFTTAKGKAWRHSNFYYRRWVPALKAAHAKGFPKSPRPHDLRHTHVAWLIAQRIPLPAIQARLGHESITTTVVRISASGCRIG